MIIRESTKRQHDDDLRREQARYRALQREPEVMTTTPQKITFGEMRASGVRDVLIYCRDHRCSHSTTARSRLMAGRQDTTEGL